MRSFVIIPQSNLQRFNASLLEELYSGAVSLSMLALSMMHVIYVQGKLMFMLSNLIHGVLLILSDPVVVFLWFLNK